MAQKSPKRYNRAILSFSKSISIKTTVVSGIASLLLITAIATPSSAQSFLQNSSGLQQQTGQTQNSASTEQQAGTLQNNNSQAVLDQSGYRPLGVVADPKQSTPDVVVQPNSSLRTETASGSVKKSVVPYLFVILFVLIVTGVYIISRGRKNPAEPVTEPTFVRPEPLPAVKPKKNKKKRRSSHRR